MKGLYTVGKEEAMKDNEIIELLTEISLCGNLHIGYMGEPPTDICDEIIYL